MCSIASLLSYFANELKSVDKGENHFQSRHVDAFQYSEGSLTGKVNASMKDKSYEVTVSQHVYDSEVGYDASINLLRDITKIIKRRMSCTLRVVAILRGLGQ